MLFALGTLVSRITGMIRDVTLAHFYGTSGQLDAYFLAILVPFYMRRIFAEGAMVSAFVPVYSRVYSHSRESANRFTDTVITYDVMVSTMVAILFIAFPEYVLKLFATGFKHDTLLFASGLFRITAFYMVIVSVWAILSAYVNYHHRFFFSALSPALVNVGVILAAWMSGESTVKYLPVGFMVGGLMQLGLVVPIVVSLGYRFRPSLHHESFGAFLRLFFTASLGYMVTQVNSIVDTNVATWLGAGAVSTLQYALRLFQLPMGLFGVAVATTALPVFSRNQDTIQEKLKDSLNLLVFLTLPITLGYLFMASELIFLIYQHGAFSTSMTLRVSSCLWMYSIGIPFYSLYLLLSRYFHARQIGSVPTMVSTVVVGCNVTLDIILARVMGVHGIALATSLSGILGAVILWILVRKSVRTAFIDRHETLKVLTATAAAMVPLGVLGDVIHSRYFIVMIMAFSVLIYLTMCKWLKLRAFLKLRDFIGK